MTSKNRRIPPKITAQSLDPASVPGPNTTLAGLVSYPDGRPLARHDNTFLGRNFAMYFWLDNIPLWPCDRLEAFVGGQWLQVRYIHDRDARMEEVLPKAERIPGGREPITIPLPTDTLFRWPQAEFERLRSAYAHDEAKEAKRKTASKTGARGRTGKANSTGILSRR